MNPGDIYFAKVAFQSRPGAKIRPVVVIEHEGGILVLVLASTSRFNPNLNLLHSVDFDHPRYFRVRQNGLSGISYFYDSALQYLNATDLLRFVGVLVRDDIATILAKVAPSVETWKKRNQTR